MRYPSILILLWHIAQKADWIAEESYLFTSDASVIATIQRSKSRCDCGYDIRVVGSVRSKCQGVYILISASCIMSQSRHDAIHSDQASVHCPIQPETVNEYHYR